MLTKILGRFMRRTTKDTDLERAIQNLPKHQQAHLLVKKLAEKKGQPFNLRVAANVSLQVIDPDIVLLKQRIESYTERLKSGDGLTPKDCFSEAKERTLDGFFTDEQGNYIPLHVFREFLESCKKFLYVVEKGLERKDRNVEYSVRLMGKCFSSIHNVCRAVEEAAT